MQGFVKFSRTPHLVWLGGPRPRGDKLATAAEATELLRHPVAVEERVDGANLGLSMDRDGRLRAQSRGHYLNPRTAGQWKPLWNWLARRAERLSAALTPSVIAYGDWCYAEHSVSYDALPDWFLLFDLYDRTKDRYWSRGRRDEWAQAAGLSTVPLIATGSFGLPALRSRLGRSRLGSEAAEGVYLRWDSGDWLFARAKIVRPGWVMASDEHWSSRALATNRLADPDAPCALG